MKRKTTITAITIILLLAGAAGTLFLSLGPRGPMGGGPNGGGPSEGGPEADGGEAGNQQASRGDPDTEDPVPVTVTRARQETLLGLVTLNGEVEADRRVDLFADVAGRVDRLAVEVGDSVEQNEAVLYVDPSRPGSEFQPSPVRSPISGVITAIDTEVGAEVGSRTPLATVSSVDRLRIVVEIPERYAQAAEVGLEGEGRRSVAQGEPFPVRVTSIAPRIDPATRSTEATLLPLEPQPTLRSGILLRVSLPLDRAGDAVSIPFGALVQEAGRQYVYLLEEGAARRVSVRTGVIAGDRVEVIEGVEAGTQVITEGHQRLRPGRPVRVVPGEGEES